MTPSIFSHNPNSTAYQRNARLHSAYIFGRLRGKDTCCADQPEVDSHTKLTLTARLLLEVKTTHATLYSETRRVSPAIHSHDHVLLCVCIVYLLAHPIHTNSCSISRQSVLTCMPASKPSSIYKLPLTICQVTTERAIMYVQVSKYRLFCLWYLPSVSIYRGDCIWLCYGCTADRGTTEPHGGVW